MKKNSLSINYSTKSRKSQYKLMLIMIITSVFAVIISATKTSAASKNVQDFYFDSFVADYYVRKDEEGVSRMKVVETFTAVFPNYNQNKGLCRRIPYTTNGGKNLTLEKLTKNNITVTRNGHSEPIYSIEENGNEEYEVCTGTDDYVTGRQAYTFEYEFRNVVTDFVRQGSYIKNNSSNSIYAAPDGSGSAWQEIYWDTNGTGFVQRFDSLTARVHFEEPEDMTGQAWCYVGSYGSNNQSRCQISRLDDGFMFETKKLSRGENLTFDIELKPGSFKLPPPTESHAMPVLASLVLGILGLITGFSLRAYIKAAPKRSYYKNILVKPEYEAPKGYDMHSLAEDYIGTHSNPSVASIVKMVTDGRIDLIKGEKKLLGGYNWQITVKNLANIERNEELILKILNGGDSVYEGQTIKLKRYYGNSRLESLGRQLDKYGRTHGHSLGLLVDDKIHGTSATVSIVMFTFCIMVIPITLTMLSTNDSVRKIIEEVESLDDAVADGIVAGFDQEYYADGRLFVGFKESVITILVSIVAATIINTFFRKSSEKYSKRTEKGLEVSRQLEGLKTYIKMAEADRIAYLQSVPGADTSPEGIVKLYEKLLPYAIFFGVEKTWLKEMNNYCELNHISSTSMDLNVSDVMLMSSFIRTIPQSTNFSSYGSSTSSSSSSHSGGGGGGFSGGGGGGGGGGGR